MYASARSAVATTAASPILWAMLFALGQQPPPPPSIGFVLSREGPWQWEGRDLKPGQGLPSGARLLLKPGTTMRDGEVFSINVVTIQVWWWRRYTEIGIR